MTSNAARNIRKPHAMGLNKIVELINSSPENIILTITNPLFGLDNYLNADKMGDVLVGKLITLFEKLMECNSLQLKINEIMTSFCQSKLLQMHVYELMSKKLANNMFNKQLIKTVLNICCKIIELNPMLTDKLSIIKDKLELLIVNRIKDDAELKDQFENRFLKLEEIALNRIEAQRNYKTFKNIDNASMEPPNDFTEMSIVPKLADILFDQTPFLRKNITNGAYKSVHHYLDVQFRLLREDYLHPLREGVGKFRNIIKEANLDPRQAFSIPKDMKHKLRSIESLNIFFDVVLEKNTLNHNGVAFQMKIKGDREKTKQMNWENSKKLMFGSLVCLSSDFFQNECLIGIICERNIDMLKRGIVFVQFDYDRADLNNNRAVCNEPAFNTVYTMLETSAFFEAYKHVLQAFVSFKNSTDDEFPFKKYLVDCETQTIERPEYLKNVIFDFRFLILFIYHKKD